MCKTSQQKPTKDTGKYNHFRDDTRNDYDI